MPRSRLEKYLSILEALVPQPLEFENISYKASLECSTLKKYLNFLISHNLVEERSLDKKRVVYAITERGLAVFKTLQAQKYFQKLKNILPVVEEASKVGSLLSKNAHGLKEEN
ncbi:MAG: winged helix-turn-helix domain-containing protein [Candidatus Bathyarchaeia archaeon]